MKVDEKSERALRLTEDVISQNAANYTAWAWRRECIFALGKSINEELKWAEKVANESAKNYQLWHHRRTLIDRLKSQFQSSSTTPISELNSPELFIILQHEFSHTEKILTQDNKNYHVWSHRQWCLKTFISQDFPSLWSNEWKFIEILLIQDWKNNSAWNQRYFLYEFSNGFFSMSIIEKEWKYIQSKLLIELENCSPWNYLEGILRKCEKILFFSENISKQWKIHSDPVTKSFMNEFLHSIIEFIQSNLKENSIFPRSTLLEIYCSSAFNENSIFIKNSIQLCEELMKLDGIRMAYWNYRKLELEQKK